MNAGYKAFSKRRLLLFSVLFFLVFAAGCSSTRTQAQSEPRYTYHEFDGIIVFYKTQDLAIYRQATGEWFIFGSATGFETRLFGAPASSGLGDTPVPADFDGDGKADLAVRRSADGTWFIFRSSLGFLQQVWGAPTDLPAPGDFDGDDKSNIAVWRPSDGTWLVLP